MTEYRGTRAHPNMTLAERLEFYSIPEPNSGCRLWLAYTSGRGWARLYWKGRLQSAAKLSWENANGPMPRGMETRHKCDNPICIDERHLEPGTHQDNMDDMVKRGRSNKGTKNPHAKLSKEQALAIIAATGTQQSIADHFGVCNQTVSEIKSGKRWAHLPRSALPEER